MFMPKLVLMWTLCLFLLPVLVLQGIWVRKTTLKLPEAAHPDRGEFGEQDPPISILGLGDSVIAGVGVDKLDESLTAQIARSTAEKTGRRVTWQVYGKNGDRVSDLLARYQNTDKGSGADLQFSNTGELLEAAVPAFLEEMMGDSAKAIQPDYVVVSVGVNDVSRLTSLTRWNFEITQVIAELREYHGVPIIFLGIPPMGDFPALAHPLKFALGVRAAMLDKTIQRAAELLPDIYWIDTHSLFQHGHMAADGYHPSASGCDEMGRTIAEVVLGLERESKQKGDTVQSTEGEHKE